MDSTVYENFTNLYPITKTLRFSLIPQFETEEWFKKLDLIADDKKRAADVNKLKKLFDVYYTWFNKTTLDNAQVEGWSALEEEFWKYKKSQKTSADRKAFIKKKEEQRKAVVQLFNNREQSDNFGLSSNPVEFFKAFNDWSKSHGSLFNECEENLCLLEEFNRFTTYFKGFLGNRNNLYSKEPKNTAIAYRAVDVNFKLFLNNKQLLKTARTKYSEIDDEIPQDLINSDCYSQFIGPSGIESYNSMIGKLNSRLNELHQQQGHSKKIKLQNLQKQILCGDRSRSFDFMVLKSPLDAFLQVKKLDRLFETTNESYLQILRSVFEDFEMSDLNRVFFLNKNLSSVSKSLYGNSNTIPNALDFCIENSKGPMSSVKTKDQKKKERNRSAFSVNELLDCCAEVHNDEEVSSCPYKEADFHKKVKEEAQRLIKESEKKYAVVRDRLPEVEETYNSSSSVKLKQRDKDLLKEYLDSVKKIERFIKLFEVQEDEDGDPAFYECLGTALLAFKEFDHIYNSIRNFATKKPYSNEKLQLTFNCPNLSYGDSNCISNHRSFICKKDGCYYLGVIPKEGSTDMSQLKKDDDSPWLLYEMHKFDPAKNVQNLLVIDGHTVKKTRQLEQLKNKYLPSEINCIRKKESYKGKNFKHDDSAKFTSYYMERLREYEPEFSYKFKEAGEYDCYNDWVSDAERQSYLLNCSYIDELELRNRIKEGSLYLFKIYSKDFSKSSTG